MTLICDRLPVKGALGRILFPSSLKCLRLSVQELLIRTEQTRQTDGQTEKPRHLSCSPGREGMCTPKWWQMFSRFIARCLVYRYQLPCQYSSGLSPAGDTAELTGWCSCVRGKWCRRYDATVVFDVVRSAVTQEQIQNCRNDRSRDARSIREDLAVKSVTTKQQQQMVKHRTGLDCTPNHWGDLK